MSSEIQTCVDTIGERLALPVSLTDVDLNSLFFSPHTEDLIDDVRRDSLLLRSTAPWVREWFAEYGVGRSNVPVRVEPHAEKDTMSRVVAPVQRRGVPHGLLCVLDPDRRCTPEALASVGDLLDQLAELMHEAETDRLEVSRLLHDVLAGTPATRARALSGLEQITSLHADTPCVVVAVSGVHGSKGAKSVAPVEVATARAAPVSPAGPVLQCAAANHHLFLIPVSALDDRPLSSQLTRITGVAGRCCGGVALGVGDAHPLSEASTSHDQARAAMSVAARLDELPDVIAFADLGALRFLATRSDVELEASIDPHTRDLLDADDHDVCATVEAYLESGCDAAATAATLNVHRGTLYYRLRKAEALTGLDLSSGPDRLTVQLSLIAHRLLDSPRRPAHDSPVRLLSL